ncbi:MAG: M1 family peptidase [Nitrospirae bacterium]|nr:M1 family peptidase [Nitrospirota bacterium]
MKPHRWVAGVQALCLFALPAILNAQPIVKHNLTVVLHPEDHRIEVEDAITLPDALVSESSGLVRFALRAGLLATSRSPGVVIRPVEPNPSPSPSEHQAPTREYAVTLTKAAKTFTLSYQGAIADEVQESKEDAGTADDTGRGLSALGVFLSGSEWWYPQFGDQLVTFTLDVRAPSGWEVISQGERTSRRRDGAVEQVRWNSPEPQDEIDLVGGPLIEYRRVVGKIAALVFLREPDQSLADRYLEATAHYLDLYQKLLGPYPYKKFALVENVRETGYGMPSFTLLGSKVIRFPFILHSSYPHEILHNWWGNGVFVDVAKGNWSEGLTAYLADHLVQEQNGTGVEYRRAALQRYADYVAAARDFPLVEFRSRHDPTTEAVGYGKALMVFHMVRRELGDDSFIGALRGFFERFRFRRATFTDLDLAFAAAAGKTSGPLAPWLEKAGAPELKVEGVAALKQAADRYLVTAVVEQTQPGPAYRLQVPVAVTLEGRDEAYQTTFRLDTKRLGVEIQVPGRPLRLDVDPEFDLFRRLDRNEIPPALSQMFGAEKVLAVLPAAAAEPLREAYRQLADSWETSHDGPFDIQWDTDVEELPTDRAVWIMGWDNRFRTALAPALNDYRVATTDLGVTIGRTDLTRDRHSVVLTVRHPADPALALGWIATDRVAALPGLGRKLPHYGKYGYLGFEGDEPANVAKGEWPLTGSPLSVLVRQVDGGTIDVPTAKLAPRQSLAKLAPAKP